jgi:KUP system potassium uptake protein
MLHCSEHLRGADMAQTYVAGQGQDKPVEQASTDSHHQKNFWSLTIGSIGVVYGDIGTSPLYAFKEAINAAAEHGLTGRAAVIGILSLIIWALLLIVTVKYVLILLRADNKGEGGTFALMALGQSVAKRSSPVLFALGIAGVSFFYGDAVITPAMSVLSAVEGLKLVAPGLERAVLPLTCVILIALFALQSRGTAKMAAFFGPITVLWFLLLALGGLVHIVDDPTVLAAFNPWPGIKLVASHGLIGLTIMGLVFLAVTGAEALYADLGHFGRTPIQTAWLGLVLPALVLNYLGQGALVLANPNGR